MNVNEALNLLSFTTRERAWGNKLIKYDWSVSTKETGSSPVFTPGISLYKNGYLIATFNTEIDAGPLQGQDIEDVVEELEKEAIAHVLEMYKGIEEENNERTNTA